MDTAQEAVMRVYVPKIYVLSFVEIPIGLYYHNTESPNYLTHKLNNYISAYSFFDMVAFKLKLYSSQEIKKCRQG